MVRTLAQRQGRAIDSFKQRNYLIKFRKNTLITDDVQGLGRVKGNKTRDKLRSLLLSSSSGLSHGNEMGKANVWVRASQADSVGLDGQGISVAIQKRKSRSDS